VGIIIPACAEDDVHVLFGDRRVIAIGRNSTIST
jgi:hypothetical protein